MPVTLRTPEVARERELLLGATYVAVPNNAGGIILPHALVAFGNGQVEFNFSTQLGLRSGMKVALEPGAALDFGLSFPFIILVPGIPLSLDAGLIWGADGFYFSPRLIWVGFQSGLSSIPSSGGFLYQANLGYYRDFFLGELGLLGAFNTSGLFFSFSAGVRF
ncbi:MAG: hypothetical protein RMK51_13180 [Meiothermus sp.]|uniref:hypothetical protein n=1 Tax=Meiothermus sp. TaxID=1955249 RepID=UPI00298ED4E5|nr:hypothetical protein [Meiothermus sp.]MDW8426877.1 hypothetical protein [Meiothermus sp.]